MATVDVLTNRFDIGRSGVNERETTLKPSNVNAQSFGKLFTRKVDGDVYAQPLVACGVDLPKVGKRNVVYVATASNSVFAFDADDPKAGNPYWQKSARDLGDPVPTKDIINEQQTSARYKDFAKSIGITSTPVIDRTASAMYVVAKHALPAAGGTITQQHVLHALDIRTGAELAALGSPRIIEASVNGSAAPDAVGGKLSFNPAWHLNRPGLLLVNGVLYLAFGSHGDWNSYHGWVLAYDSKTLQQLGAFCDTPNGTQGGIWQSGTGLSSDGSDVFYVSGNGSVGNGNTSLCIGRLRYAGGQLRATGGFIPGDWANLDKNDWDLCTAAVVVPNEHEIIACAKTGWAYAVDTSDANSVTLKQPFLVSEAYTSPYSPISHESNCHGSPVVWQSSTGINVFAWGECSRLNAFHRTPAGYQPNGSSSMQVPYGMPGAMMAISADGADPATAILWASHPYTEVANSVGQANANNGTVSAILRAFLASDVSIELWNSEMQPARDRVGYFAKFCTPTIVNGKVYLATFSDPNGTEAHELVVYGPLQDPPASGPRGWTMADIGTPVVSKFNIAHGRVTITAAGDDIEQWADSFSLLYEARPGDATITARVRALDNRDPWVKACVMIRDSVDPSSPHGVTIITPGNGTAFQSRAVFRGAYRNQSGPQVKVAYWIRAQRRANVVTGSVSPDGTHWTVVGNDTIAFAGRALLGLALSSHVNGVMEVHPYATAVFDSVEITTP